MCTKFIGFGKCSKSYKYILYAIILKLIDDNFFSFTSVSPEKKISYGFDPVLGNHIIIQNFYKYVIFIIGGLLFRYISNKNSKRKKTLIVDNDKLSDKTSESPTLLHHKRKLKRMFYMEVMIVSFIYALHNELLDILYSFNISNLYIWTFHIVSIFIFMKKYFHIKFYNYQKCSFISMIILVSILLIIALVLPVSEENSQKTQSAYDIINLLTGNSKYIIIFLFIIGINLISIIMAYTRVRAKVLIDLKYMSPYSIIIFVGIFGIIITMITLIITTNYKCKENISSFCMTILYDQINNTNTTYFDNINIYFQNLNERKNDYRLYIEIIIILPIFLIINFFEMVCEIWIIIQLNPIFVLIQNNFCYLINDIIFVLINYNTFEEFLALPQFLVSETAELIAIICYLIYLQIIELRFCGLDMYLNKNLIKISHRESEEYISTTKEEEEEEGQNGNIEFLENGEDNQSNLSIYN